MSFRLSLSTVSYASVIFRSFTYTWLHLQLTVKMICNLEKPDTQPSLWLTFNIRPYHSDNLDLPISVWGLDPQFQSKKDISPYLHQRSGCNLQTKPQFVLLRSNANQKDTDWKEGDLSAPYGKAEQTFCSRSAKPTGRPTFRKSGKNLSSFSNW